MKTKHAKRTTGFLLALLMAFAIPFTTLAAEDEQTSQDAAYTEAEQMAKFTIKGYNNGTLPLPTTIFGLLQYTLQTFVMGDDYNGPIGMVQGTLVQNGVGTPVYIVALSGTELIWSSNTGLQGTEVVSDMLCGFDLENAYSIAVRDAILEHVPANSNIVLYGHSLGGMVAQEIAADPQIKEGYNVLNTVTFGSPMIKLLGCREGIVRRLCDTSDIVPYLSVYTATPLVIEQVGGSERYEEDGGYNNSWLAAHNESYIRADVWGSYDALGEPDGNASISFNMDEVIYYEAPAIPWLSLR